MQYLLANYDKSVRPSFRATEPLNVTFGVALTQIIDVDERNQILTTNCWLNEIWIDNNLRWNESDFGGISVIRIPAEKVWKPDIILYNNADSQFNDAMITTNVIVAPNGNLTFLISAIFKSSCKINVAYFPFDEQRCSMKFASWTYDGWQVNLVDQTGKGDISNYVTNGEWDLIDMIAERNVVYYSCCPKDPYVDVTIHIVLRRRPLFYVFNLILPCMLITTIALMSFYMPSDSGEKVTLGITTLLSMTVFLMVVGESMPPTSETLPLIALYYGVTISLVSLATGLSVVTLNIHHRGITGRPPSSLVRKFIFGFVAKALCIKFEPLERPEILKKAEFHTPVTELNSNAGERIATSDIDKFNGENGRISPQFMTTRNRNNMNQRNIGQPLHVPPPSSITLPEDTQLTNVLYKLAHLIERNEIRLSEQEVREAIKQEWQYVALVVDRLLLWIFIITTICATLGILGTSPHARLY
ncbi:CHRNA9 (predicted) [Pycnogonum litorale]